jgi:hypothetical protein
MESVKKYWIVVVLGAVLMATLVGVAGARPQEGSLALEPKNIEGTTNLAAKQQSKDSKVARIESHTDFGTDLYREENIVLRRRAEWLEEANEGSLPSPEAAPTKAVVRRITVPAAFFHPIQDGYDWYNAGRFINTSSGGGNFMAPVVFPTGQSVVVESITIYGYDNNATYNMTVELYLVDVTVGSHSDMATVSSTGNVDTTRSFTDSSIDYNPVKHGKGVYLWLTLGDDANLDLYGVRIQYHHGTT